MTINFVGDSSSHVAVVPGIIQPEVCNNLVESCKKDWNKLFYPGPTITGVDTTVKYTMDFNFSGSQARDLGCDYETYKFYEDEIGKSLWTAISLYVEAYSELRAAPELWDSGFRLQYYKKGSGYYRRHHDGAPWDPEPTSLRVLGVVMYLNTVERGGETAFPMHNFKVKAEMGSIALFPASWTHPHQACVPVSDDKWIVSTFITSTRRPPAPNERHGNAVHRETVPVTVIDTNPANQSSSE